MPATAGGIYGGVTAAARRADRRHRLLAAGLDVIGTQGWSAATVRAICAQAGLSSRFFYESFAGVEELAVALFEDIFESTAAKVSEVVAASPRDPRLRNTVAIETFVRSLTDDRRTAQFVFMESLGNGELARRRTAIVHAAAETVLNPNRASRASRRVTQVSGDRRCRCL